MKQSWIVPLVCIASLSTGHALGQVYLDDAMPFYRFADETRPDSPLVEPKKRVGLEYRDILAFPWPYHTKRTRVDVAQDNTIRLGDFVDTAALSRDAYGISVVIETMLGRTYHYLTFVDGPGDGLAEDRVSVLPPFIQGHRERLSEHVFAWAREAFAMPRVHRSEVIRIPETGRLAFGLGFVNPLLDGASRTTSLQGFDPDEGWKRPQLLFSIIAEHDGGSTPLYAQELRPPENPLEGNWLDVEVDVSPLRGRDARLVFRIDAAPGAGLEAEYAPFSGPLWGDPVLIRAGGKQQQDKANLILISLDTLRADHLGCYGYGRDTSPNLDRFAEEALLFERCISTSSWTTPAHASVFTGLPMATHRAGAGKILRLGNAHTTLAELAREGGYRTAAFTQGVAMRGELGMYQGFDRYSDGVAGTKGSRTGIAEKIFRQGTSWLDRFGASPFFLFLHTYEIHTPYLPPKPFDRMFTDGPTGTGIPEPEMDSAEERAHMIGLYDGGIAYTDAALGSFFEHLRKKGYLENTIVIVFSDHGEEFWEHGGVRHALTLYQEQLHVPLIIRMPGEQPPAGRIENLVSLVDIFATAAELLGLEYRVPSSSLSLAPFLTDPARPAAYTRSLAISELYQRGNGKGSYYYMVAAQTDRYKYIGRSETARRASPMHRSKISEEERRVGKDVVALVDFLARSRQKRNAPSGARLQNIAKRGGSELFFDLSSDRAELSPLADAQSPKLLEVSEAALSQLRRFSQEALAAGRPLEDIAPLTEEEIREFEALGYLQ